MQAKRKAVPRRQTRVELPTLEEAIQAAEGMTDDVKEQAQIAGSLMGVSEDEVVSMIKAAVPKPRQVLARASGRATVVIERKSRRLVSSMASRDTRAR